MKTWVTIKQSHGVTWSEHTTMEAIARSQFIRLSTDNDRAESRVTQFVTNLETLETHVARQHTGKLFA